MVAQTDQTHATSGYTCAGDVTSTDLDLNQPCSNSQHWLYHASTGYYGSMWRDTMSYRMSLREDMGTNPSIPSSETKSDIGPIYESVSDGVGME